MTEVEFNTGFARAIEGAFLEAAQKSTPDHFEGLGLDKARQIEHEKIAAGLECTSYTGDLP